MITIEKTILRPIVSEKTVAMQNKFVFEIDRRADVALAKKAFVEFYGIDPQKILKINSINLPPKKKFVARGKLADKRKKMKTFVVTLVAGEKLDFNNFK